jgi:16S rRNA (cytidine1402-2'-O)-methyltransferase
MGKGKLYIVATPIGNMADITLRALDVLKEVDFIAAEDTRRTQKLLNYYQIKGNLLSFHEYSDKKRMDMLLGFLEDGKNVALVSDAGTPLISDPGYILIRNCMQSGTHVESLPGACAAVTAVTLCGIDCRNFLFAGFLPAKGAARQKELQRYTDMNVPVVIYESPNRIVKTLGDICEVMGDDVQVCVAREMTKIYEEVITVTARQAFENFSGREQIKGEFVLVVGIPSKEEVSEDTIGQEIIRCIDEDKMTKKEAVTFVAASLSIPKNRVYSVMLKQKL